MQNKIVKMTRASLALMVVIWLGTLPVMAERDCEYVFWWEVTFEEAQTCLNKGVDVHERDSSGVTPLHRAAWNENPKVVMALLDAGADVHVRSKRGWTPLHRSAYANKNPEVTIALLRAGADIDARDDIGSTPLQWAAFRNENPKVIIVLLKAGADAKATNGAGETAFSLAEENGDIKGTKAYWMLNDALYK